MVLAQQNTTTATPANVFQRLGLPQRPVVLAPLAGVSDYPFRRVCTEYGADLTYVEMISARALVQNSKQTLVMLARYADEPLLGVQITSGSAADMGAAVELLNPMNFATIDINMGCPVAKVVKSGCGSAILQDPERVYQTVRAACAASDRPVSAKIRLGWDRLSLNYLEVADAAVRGGAQWLTVHGRTRSENYSDPVDLAAIAELKKHLAVPVLGNGNVFCRADAQLMAQTTAVDGWMVSRGALGNPWVFGEIKHPDGAATSLETWLNGVLLHLRLQNSLYGSDSRRGAVCLRKHVLWYVKGWPGARKTREVLAQLDSLEQLEAFFREYAETLAASGVSERQAVVGHLQPAATEGSWDPKYDMDRQLDRGLSDEVL